MKENLKVFSNEDFGNVRIIEIEGKPYFNGKDVALELGYSNTRDAIARHCRGVVKHDRVIESENQYGIKTKQTVNMTFIPEGAISQHCRYTVKRHIATS